jgi:serine/threonine-protein kinase RsbW
VIIGGWRGPAWRVTGPDPSHAGPMRRWVASAIGQHGCPVERAEAELVVGELFANAVVHGPALGRVLTGYCLWREGARIVVCDGGGTTTPMLRQADDQAEGWRGLELVGALAARWGHFRLDSAQAVWCDLGQPLYAAPSDAWAWLRLVLAACPLSSPAPPCTAAASRERDAAPSTVLAADLAGVS